MNNMMKHKQFIALIVLLALVISLLPFKNTETAYANGINYENAKDFYENTGNNETGSHSALYNGCFYIANRAKKASSSTTLKYQTLGYDIELRGNGNSVSISVVIDESLEFVHKQDGEISGKMYEYNLYYVHTERLKELIVEASRNNLSIAESILSSDSIEVTANAIMTEKKNEVPKGKITEDGKGGINVDENYNLIYRLKNADELAKMEDRFGKVGSGKFKSYCNIRGTIVNYESSIIYSVGEDVSFTTGFNVKDYAATSTQIVPNVLYKNNSVYIDSYKLTQEFYLLNLNGIVSKKGYHIDSANAWKKSNGTQYSLTKKYMPKDFNANAGIKRTVTVIYANWQPNTCTVHYNANGGKGTVLDTVFTYDKKGTLANNTFTKEGYRLPAGAEWKDSAGKTYAAGAEILNTVWLDNHGTEITLYANWQPSQIIITTDKQGGTGGTDWFYQWYGIGNFSDAGYVNPITGITIPSLTGHTFEGYWTITNGDGIEVVKADGTITNAYFFQDTVIYANWKPETYKITLDNQGADIFAGTALYYEKYNLGNYRDKDCTDAISNIAVPQKTGYVFGGYYTERYGNGDAYVSTSGRITSDSTTFTSNTTLYAYWIPNVYEITLDMQGGTPGTTHFYVKYGEGFYSDWDCQNAITSITIPTKAGNIFKSYWTFPNSVGESLINHSGTGTTTEIGLSTTYFKSSTTLYASWEAKIFRITFDKQGGINGTDFKEISTGEPYPMADAPQRGTYTFKGYYTGTNGTGEMIYDMYMNTTKLYALGTDQTLYAYWEDETAPILNLLTDYASWTNKEVTLTANAQDYGSGLSSVYIYILNDDGSISADPVASAENLNGATSYQLPFVNPTEGIIRYKAIATDVQGLTSESINVVYYDKTPPSGTQVSGGKDGNNFEFEFDITDINPGN